MHKGIECFGAVAGLGFAVGRVNSVRDSSTAKLVWIIGTAGILTGAGIGTLRLGFEQVEHWRNLELSDRVSVGVGIIFRVFTERFLGFKLSEASWEGKTEVRHVREW